MHIGLISFFVGHVGVADSMFGGDSRRQFHCRRCYMASMPKPMKLILALYRGNGDNVILKFETRLRAGLLRPARNLLYSIASLGNVMVLLELIQNSDNITGCGG